MGAMEPQVFGCRCAAALGARQRAHDQLASIAIHRVVIGHFVGESRGLRADNSSREVMERQFRPLAEDDRALDYVGKLPNISWPGVSDQFFACFVGNGGKALLSLS